MEQAKDYNGWKNRQTWNVALWINNDESMYRLAVAYVQKHGKKATYHGFIKSIGMVGESTPDGISYSGSRLDHKALNEMIRELLD